MTHKLVGLDLWVVIYGYICFKYYIFIKYYLFKEKKSSYTVTSGSPLLPKTKLRGPGY